MGIVQALRLVGILGGRFLTHQLSVSSVTQTWLVSRRRGKEQPTTRDGESDEQTVTICRPSVGILATSSKTADAQHFNLAFGIHKFLFDAEGELRVQTNFDGRADFEIDVNSAGAFFFSLSEEHPVRVNGRGVGWVRLRSDDVLEVRDWTLRIDSGAVVAEDRTVLARTVTSAAQSKNSPKKKPRRFASLAILLVVFPAMLMIALIAGYVLAQKEMHDTARVGGVVAETAIADTKSEVAVDFSSEHSPARTEKVEKMAATAFGKVEFEELVTQFRSGKKNAACEKLRARLETANKGVWRSKGLLLFKRRCGGG